MGGKGILITFMVLTYTAVVFSRPGQAAPQAAEGADAQQSCVTAKCHAQIGKEQFVHQPVSEGQCDACHTQTGKHKFAPITEAGQLCEQCHEKKTGQKVVHPPVQKGQCTKCHDPHQSPYKYQLRAKGADLCFLCHDRSRFSGAFVHGPAAVGSCTTCHSPHQSDNAKLLMTQGNDLCFTCHPDMGEGIKNAKFVHTPVRDSCVNCHSPHSGNFRYNLPADPNRDLCLTCHADKEQDLKDATVPHKALDGERKCLTCHDPHYSSNPRQLRKQPVELCLSCHDREYNGQNGKLANMKAVLQSSSDKHGPIREGDCSGCHNPHGSKNFRMLREVFPPVFYAPYNEDNYKLCFMCHENSIANDEFTTTLTNFRNGNRNLHYVHVHKTVKGRTCRACHDPHGSNNPKHIRDSVPFGKWQLPIGYQKTPTGGSCQPGCHPRVGYDRVTAVVNKPPQAAP